MVCIGLDISFRNGANDLRGVPFGDLGEDTRFDIAMGQDGAEFAEVAEHGCRRVEVQLSACLGSHLKAVRDTGRNDDGVTASLSKILTSWLQVNIGGMRGSSSRILQPPPFGKMLMGRFQNDKVEIASAAVSLILFCEE